MDKTVGDGGREEERAGSRGRAEGGLWLTWPYIGTANVAGVSSAFASSHNRVSSCSHFGLPPLPTPATTTSVQPPQPTVSFASACLPWRHCEWSDRLNFILAFLRALSRLGSCMHLI